VKINLLPLYSQLNPGVGSCPLGCNRICQVRQQAPKFGYSSSGSNSDCPLSLHQAQTYAAIQGNADIIFNTSATGDGKSLAAYLASLLNPSFNTISLYPTIELVADQEVQIIGDSENQIEGYCQKFGIEDILQVDSLYGAELARRVEAVSNHKKFKELLRVIKQNSVVLTNPDIFHITTHFRYYDPAYNRAELPILLARNPDLYVVDEFPIFGAHQEAAILNSILLIKHSRSRRRPMKFLFTSATPKEFFIKMLQQAGLNVTPVTGNYASEYIAGYRPILQPANLEFVQLERESDALAWLTQQSEEIRRILESEGQGRGLIILNSVALVSLAVNKLKELLPDDKFEVVEISGRIDRRERRAIQAKLRNSPKSVLVIATSAVDVGVDFRIHLLIFEASDSATSIQRLGRLGRHSGFLTYNAIVLLSGRTPWVMARLQEQLTEGQEISRADFRAVIADAFDPPREFEQYGAYWGALQAQGMLMQMAQGNKESREVIQPLQTKIADDLRKVYGEQLDKKRGHWFALGKDKTGQAVQNELLRFRGGSDLQAAVWDNSRFYTYDLLRLLAYTEVEVIDRDEFLSAAQKCNHAATEFDERYIQVYLKVQNWVDKRFQIELECSRASDELKECTLSLIDKLTITGHPQKEVNRCLRQKQLLAFLVSVNKNQNNSHWDVSRKLHLSPTFGLYRLTDGDNEVYACAFNQDALLLEALKWRLKRCERTKPYIF
jgi:CRISPR-associated endonuclease/helicase Cas3